MESVEIKSGDKRSGWWIWLGCVLFVVMAGLHSASSPVGGGDTWVAMVCGRYSVGPWAMKYPGRTWQMKVLDKFGVHITRHDPFSAKSREYNPAEPGKVGWINQNWLTHVLFYKMFSSWGENSIVIYKFIQAVLTALFAYWAARVLGAHPLIAASAAGFGILLSRSFVDLRPNVSTILFAAIMVLLLAYWKRGRCWALVWMIPLMIVWVNIHGGFIYAIMIFAIAAGGYLATNLLDKVFSGRLVTVGWRNYFILLAALLGVLIVPVLFSPFGKENLIHPLIIATGEDGKIWRNVIEWKPIWDKDGFGNAGPYVVFLYIGAVVWLLWWVMLCLKPKEQLSNRRKRNAEEDIAWPKIDLAQAGIIVITIIMSVKSRRFIFLSGVVLSPFLSQMVQEIINMARCRLALRRGQGAELPPMRKSVAVAGSMCSLAGAIVMGVVFFNTMKDTYQWPCGGGDPDLIFWRMVGIPDQPRRAMEAFDGGGLKGVVFNEWSNGGFVAFKQKPEADTGEPPCKVYIDGRAQAAYEVGHFTRQGQLRFYLPDKHPQARDQLSHLAELNNISKDDPQMYDKLIKASRGEAALKEQLQKLSQYEPDLYVKLRGEELNEMIRQGGFDRQDPELYDKLIQRSSRDQGQYYKLIRVSVAAPDLYSKILSHEGINVALLRWSKSEAMISLLERSSNWQIYYRDNYPKGLESREDYILVDVDSPLNKHLLRRRPSK